VNSSKNPVLRAVLRYRLRPIPSTVILYLTPYVFIYRHYVFAGEDLASLESIIDERLGPDEDVQGADFNIIISSIKDFIMPIKIIERSLKNPPCGVDYKECQAYNENRCFGCPATNRYKGVFF
jgi:hypothetical protein